MSDYPMASAEQPIPFNPATAVSAALAYSLVPTDRMGRREFRSALLSELPPIRRATTGIVMPLLMTLLPVLIQAIIQLLARRHAADPTGTGAALTAAAAEDLHPVATALMPEDYR